MTYLNRASLTAMLRLVIFSAIALVLVSAAYVGVRSHIEQQTLNALLSQFRAIAPQVTIGERFLQEAKSITLAGIPSTLYTAKADGKVQAYFIQASTNKGYNGNITLLIGIAPDNRTLLGVRAVKQQETPGLGDKIDTRVSNWIHEFDDTSLATKRFHVKKDGGDFDEFTGATITPRAVTNLVGTILAAWTKQQTEEQQ